MYKKEIRGFMKVLYKKQAILRQLLTDNNGYAAGE